MLIRYSRWDGSQAVPDLDADDLLSAMADDLMLDGDPWRALRRLFQQGLQHPEGQRTPGLQDLLKQLRQRRQQQLDRYDLGSALEDIKKKLADIIQKEREGVKDRLAGKSAEQKLAELDALPPDPAGQIHELQSYDFVDPEAKRLFDELMQALRAQMLQPFLKGMQQALQGTTPEDLRRDPLERLLHALEEGLEHLRAERLHELVEQALRLRIHEVVALQLVDLAGRVRRKRVELGELLLGRLAGETVLDPLSLLLDDVGELLLDVLQCGAEIVAVELLLPPLPELLQEILEPRRPLTLRMLEALLEQAPERAPGIAVEHAVVGHRGQEIVGVEVRDRLRAVPARVADQHGCVDYRACRILRS